MINYQEFLSRDHFNFEEILATAYGTLVSDPPPHFDARLPAPPFLMIDRIRKATTNMGELLRNKMSIWMPGIFSVISLGIPCSQVASVLMLSGSC